MDFKGSDKVKIILGTDRVAEVVGFESHTRGHSVRIKFDNSDHEMLVYEGEILLANDPELTRIKAVQNSLMQKGYRGVALIKKSGDSKIYHKALKSSQDIFTIKKQCEKNSTCKIKYEVFMVM